MICKERMVAAPN